LEKKFGAQFNFSLHFLFQSADQEKWQMSFVMPSKYGSNLPLPKDQSVTIKEVPRKFIAVAAFSGIFVEI
jgi:SOUL heme-binding protein